MKEVLDSMLSRRSVLGAGAQLGVAMVLGSCARSRGASASPALAHSRDDLVELLDVPEATRVQLPPGTFLNEGDPVLVPPGVQVEAPQRTTLRGTGVLLSRGARISGIDFVGDQVDGQHAASAPPAPGQDDVQILGCTFTSYQVPVYVDLSPDGGEPARWVVAGNRFADCRTGVVVVRADRHQILRNTFAAARPDAQAIMLLGGAGTTVSGNVINGGTTGILLLSSRSVTGPRGQFVGNEISRNTVSGCSEEHISLDCKGNVSEDVATFERDHVAGQPSPSTVTLAHPGWRSAGSRYTGYHLAFNTGAAAGTVRMITAHRDGDFTLDAGCPPGLRAGDTVIVGAPFVGNRIEQNRVEATAGRGTASIALYGMCYDNDVVGNECLGADLWVRSLNSLVKAHGQVTDTYGAAPSESNRVVRNVVTNANILVDYLDFGRAAPYDSHHNVVTGNSLGDGVTRLVRQQDSVVEGNGVG